MYGILTVMERQDRKRGRMKHLGKVMQAQCIGYLDF